MASAPARVVITGGCGFLGQMLARSLLRRGTLCTHTATGVEGSAPIGELVLADVASPPRLLFEELEQRAEIAVGDVSDAEFCRSLVGRGDGPLSVFHLGAVMSGQGEADFDLCVNVNLHGTLHMLEAARRCGAPRPRFVMTSAGATLGSGAPTDWVTQDDAVSDATRATPHTTYGMTKACAELLLADYSRRGFVDGRGCRLPSVVCRAGAPNAATTGVYSAVVRETLAGVDTSSPIGPGVGHAVVGHRPAVDALLTMHEASATAVDATLGFDRTVFVPSIAVTLAQLDAAVRAAVPPHAASLLGRVTYDVDERLSAAVGSFPTRVTCERAKAIGMWGDELTTADLVRHYAEDFPDALAEGVTLLGTDN
mmetsp:Transcript_25556/g.83526  ORF Transcript_25556/g.83526 Transcript_25556/m.83526 type:complete len:368 (-) Transcript_25556:2297-3400(-)